MEKQTSQRVSRAKFSVSSHAESPEKPRGKEEKAPTSDPHAALREFSEVEERLLAEIEARKKSQLQLERRKALLRSFFDLSPMIMAILELRGSEVRAVRLNKTAKEFAGLSDEQIADSGLPKAPPEVSRVIVQQLQDCLKQSKPKSFEYSREIRGERKLLSVTVAAIGISKSGHPRFSYVAVDVTQARELEMQVAESERRLTLAQNFAHIGTWEFNAVTGSMGWSANMKEIFGLPAGAPTPDESSFFDLIHPEDREALRQSIQESVEQKKDHHAEFRVLLPDGGHRWVEGRGHALFNDEGAYEKMLGVAIDITERKATESALLEKNAQLQSMAKMSSLGEMAGGMAHEINNPLTIIAGSAAVAKRELKKAAPDQQRLAHSLEKIEQTAMRISKIVEGLRFFARDGSQDLFERVSPRAILSDTLALCAERLRRKGVHLEIAPVSPELQFDCRPVQVGQILLNLINNAHDALENHGPHLLRLEVEETGGRLRFYVSDSGPGLPDHLRERAFEPFFTTKPPGSGTGLGLSLSRGIAEAHGGSLRFLRRRGLSSFCLDLPKRQPTSEAGEA